MIDKEMSKCKGFCIILHHVPKQFLTHFLCSISLPLETILESLIFVLKKHNMRFSDVSSGGVATCSMKNQKCCVKDQVIWGWKVLVSPPTHAVVV